MAAGVKKKSTKSKSKTSFSTKLMVSLNMVAAILLLLSYLAQYISPLKFWPLAFAGLAYPVFLLLNLFFVLFWGVFLKKYILISLIVIALGFNQIQSYLNISGKSRTLAFEKSLKVMSYNVRLFDLYNWKNESGKVTREEIFKLFSEEAADILCLQEYYSGAGKNADFADSICLHAGYKYKNVELINNQYAHLPYGLAVFSKYKIVGTSRIEFDNSYGNFGQVCDVLVGNDTIRLLNMHLESVKFGKEDYNFVNDITNDPGKNENLKQGLIAIVRKIKKAYIRRAPQIEKIAEYANSSPYPVILTGDLNDTPVSYCYKLLSDQLDDTFVEAGKGFGQTHSQMLPFLRIDFIFHSPVLKVLDHKTLDKDYSDHYPVVARFNMP